MLARSLGALRPRSACSVNRCVMCLREGGLEQRHLVYGKKFFTGRAFYQCRHCGFAFDVLGGPTPDSFYQEHYSADRFDRSSIDFDYRKTEAIDLSMCLANSGVVPHRVLEIGPGPGWFMESFLACNPQSRYDVVELTDYGAEACRQAGAAQVHAINFETENRMAGLAGQYDVVVSIHCVEHLFNPLAALANMLRCVKPGGVLYLHTPNYGNARDKQWFHYTAPDHICFFSPDSFRRLGDVLGYDVPITVVAYDDNDVIALLRPRPGLWWRMRRALLARVQRRPVI